MGAAFMVLLPELMEWLYSVTRGSVIEQMLSLKHNIAFLREIAIGMVIVLFLVFQRAFVRGMALTGIKE